MASSPPHEHHHAKKGSFTNLFSRFFKPKERKDSKDDLHEKDRKHSTAGPHSPLANETNSLPHPNQTKREPHDPNQQRDTLPAPNTTTATVANGTENTNTLPPANQDIPNLPHDTKESTLVPSKPRPPTPEVVPTTVSETHPDATHDNNTHIRRDTRTPPTSNTHATPHDIHTQLPPSPPDQNKDDYTTAHNLPTNASSDHLDNHNHTPSNNHTPTEYVPLPFYEGSPKPSHNPPHPQKPRNSGPPEILPEEIEYDTTNDFLGQGSFGSVYKGRCRGQEVAVKIPRKQKLSLSELTNFRNEVKIMSKIYHPNVVLFLGACTQMGKMQIVTERCMTDLEKLLASKRPLSLYERMRMAKDAALGMNWLHGITRIVHNDLKSANLLVDNHMRVKVTDFGFSSIKEGDQFVDKSKKGTPLWMAPEVMMGQPYDDKADVYSFGIILWEIVTRDVPYKHHTDYNTFSRAVCYEHERPPLPLDTMPSLRYLITNCWDHNSKTRPSFNEIVFRISEVMVECMIENENARQLWKKYFLLPKQELLEQVPWADFAACIGTNWGIKSSTEVCELTSNLKRLLISLPRDTMGLVNEVVTMERFDKVVKWFGEFFDPEFGPKVSKEINILATQSWFHWDITRDEATSRLAMHEEGTFLLRLSSTDPKTTPFTLSMTGNQHRRIKRVQEGYKVQGKPKVYADLPDLVANCEDYKLLKPCPKIDTSNPYAIESFN